MFWNLHAWLVNVCLSSATTLIWRLTRTVKRAASGHSTISFTTRKWSELSSLHVEPPGELPQHNMISVTSKFDQRSVSCMVVHLHNTSIVSTRWLERLGFRSEFHKVALVLNIIYTAFMYNSEIYTAFMLTTKDVNFTLP